MKKDSNTILKEIMSIMGIEVKENKSNSDSDQTANVTQTVKADEQAPVTPAENKQDNAPTCKCSEEVAALKSEIENLKKQLSDKSEVEMKEFKEKFSAIEKLVRTVAEQPSDNPAARTQSSFSNDENYFNEENLTAEEKRRLELFQYRFEAFK